MGSILTTYSLWRYLLCHTGSKNFWYQGLWAERVRPSALWRL